MKIDATSQASIRESLSEIRKSFTDIDVLINNTGIISGRKTRYHALGQF